jgi:peptidoglycan/LPS O-acetylase OafA/YrhL
VASPSGSPRLHALDGLRAAMMLLGLILHSAASYTHTPLGDAWPYQDAQTSRLFDGVVFVIHLFRMPAFFVMAGFFAAFLYARDSAAGFLKHRVRRILLPFAAAWIVTAPAIASGFFAAHARQSGWDRAVALVTGPGADTAPNPMHLWFLYYLLIFCVGAALLMPLIRRVPARLRAACARALRAAGTGIAGLLVMSAVTIATLVPMAVPALETSVSFLPAVRVLAAYAVFFGYGWLLFTNRDRLPAFAVRPWTYFGAAIGLSVAYMSVVQNPSLAPEVRHYAGIITAGVAMWLFVFAWIGIFVRYFASPRPVQRYLADGSYWIYLVHLPFTIWIPALLAPVAVPAIVKFLIVLSGTTLATVLSYHYFVRNTWIGVLLNGRRYPRAWPAAPAATPGAWSAGPLGPA